MTLCFSRLGRCIVTLPLRRQSIKDIEKVTNHDVKAVEYYLKEAFDTLGLDDYKDSSILGDFQDINNRVPCPSRRHGKDLLPGLAGTH
jgi:hypothetical protein